MIQNILNEAAKGFTWIPSTHCLKTGRRYPLEMFFEFKKELESSCDSNVKATLLTVDHIIATYES